MEQKIAQFRFKSYQIYETQILYDNKKKIGDKFSIKFNRESYTKNEENTYLLNIGIKITDGENNNLSVSVKVQGVFEFDSDLDDQRKEVFFNQNAPAILFPYIRAYITALTSLSGINPLILPTINLYQTINREDEKDVINK